MKEKLAELKGEIGDSIVTVGNFNMVLSVLDKKSRQKKTNEIEGLNNTKYQLDPLEIYKTFYLVTIEYTFFSSSQGYFPG